jgi:hypothetical protein
MAEIIDWLTKLKTDKPENASFITKFEKYIFNDVFNSSDFENAVKNGLKIKAEEVNKTLNLEENA